MSSTGRVEHVTCLGCGCGCDDVSVEVSQGRIIDASPACPLGRTWFGDGLVPTEVLGADGPVPLDSALAKAGAELVAARGNCFVYLGSDLTSQAQRVALAIADLLRATVDCATSETAANGLITAQRRGRAGATLGEIRNRGDVFLFWGVDPVQRYPRFLARYGPESVGTHTREGRSGRYVISVRVGADTSVTGADLTLELEPEEEITALSLMRAAVQGHQLPASSPAAARAQELTGRLVRARYAVLVHDAEPTAERRNPLRAEALVALTQALNAPTRAALCSLRAGGNRVGAESVLTWQTGYPMAVDYSRGYPQYRPEARGIMSSAPRAALLVGSLTLDDPARTALSHVSTIAVGPRASESGLRRSVTIDTGVAGIHESGSAYRMDEVPLTLRAPLPGPRSATEVLLALKEVIRRELEERPG